MLTCALLLRASAAHAAPAASASRVSMESFFRILALLEGGRRGATGSRGAILMTSFSTTERGRTDRTASELEVEHQPDLGAGGRRRGGAGRDGGVAAEVGVLQ